MPAIRRLLILPGVLALAALAVACADDGTAEPQPTSTPRPIPTPVEFEREPQGAELGDPSFEPLPGARADFGRLGGSIYRIEVPDDWNGRLVLYLHGFRNFAPTLRVNTPGIRGYLIRNGYAWASSSCSSNSLVPGLAADETAALWDYFVQQFGRPELAYVTGHSMGGGGSTISAERYADRFDGALGLCGMAGNTPELGFLGDYFVAGAFAADVTQADFDSTAVDQLVDARILPAVEDPATHDRFENLVIDLTGGPRPFDHQGFVWRETANWEASEQILAPGLFDNQETVYELGTLSDVSGEEFNAAAIRVAAGAAQELFTAGQEITGDLQMPLLTLHTTGDLFVPISQEQRLRRSVEAAGKGDLLVQRAVQAPGHCTFTNAEWERGLEALIAWVEDGVKPEGEDLLADDLSTAGAEFTLAPRLGSLEADEVPGANERITVSGTLTVDGEALDGTLRGVVVRADGLERVCHFTSLRVSDGHYEVVAAGDGEVTGCGAPGAEFYLLASVEGELFTSQELFEWPKDGKELIADATFSTADRTGVREPATTFTGSALGSTGERVMPGTVIEAYIGETLCGISSLPPVVMAASDPATYSLIVVGPDAVSGCEKDGEISFRVDGEIAQQTETLDLDGEGEPHDLDLTLP